MPRFWFSLLLSAALTVALIGSICAYKYWDARELHDDPSLGQILRFQLAKIDSLQPGEINTALLGDSSLGNAIDANLLNSQFGLKAKNFALTGSFAYAGTTVLMEKLSRRVKLKNVILYFTPDALARSNYEGFFFTGGSLISTEIPIKEKIDIAKLYASKLFDAKSALQFVFSKHQSQATPEQLKEYDYILSSAAIRLDTPAIQNFSMPDAFSPQAIVFFNEMSRICKREGWNCIYVHGTMLERLVKRAEVSSFISATNEFLAKQSTLRLASTSVIGIPDDDRGDTMYHVNWRLRDKYTRILGETISPLLRR